MYLEQMAYYFLNYFRFCGIFKWIFIQNIFLHETVYRKVGLGPAYALGDSSFFKKYERKNREFFTWRRKSDFGNLYPSLIEKIEFPFFWKKDLIFKGQK